MRLYSIKDKLAGEFGPPFVSKNDDTALRTSKRIIGESISPDDFELYYICTISDDEGKVIYETGTPELVETRIFKGKDDDEPVADKAFVR